MRCGEPPPPLSYTFIFTSLNVSHTIKFSPSLVSISHVGGVVVGGRMSQTWLSGGQRRTFIHQRGRAAIQAVKTKADKWPPALRNEMIHHLFELSSLGLQTEMHQCPLIICLLQFV